MSLDAVLDLLQCPHCARSLRRRGSTVCCGQGHTFDPARQGYLNLLGSRQPRHADTSTMVAARESVQASGALDPVFAALGRIDIDDEAVILDCGAGPGRYVAAMVGSAVRRRGVAIDISVPACRRAAQVHPRVGAVVADAWQRLPLGDATVDVVSSIFAPRNGPEFARILKTGGEAVVVTPLDDHLIELRESLGLLGIDPDKDRRLEVVLSGPLELVASESVTSTRDWDARTAGWAVAMGPNAFHLEADTLNRRIDAVVWPRPVTVACRVSRWRPRPR